MLDVELERFRTSATAQLTWVEVTAEAWALLSADEQPRALRGVDGKLYLPLCLRCLGLLNNAVQRQRLLRVPQV